MFKVLLGALCAVAAVSLAAQPYFVASPGYTAAEHTIPNPPSTTFIGGADWVAAESRAARISRTNRRLSQADSVSISRAAASAISRFASGVTRALTTSVQLMGHNVSQR